MALIVICILAFNMDLKSWVFIIVNVFLAGGSWDISHSGLLKINEYSLECYHNL